MPQLLKKEVGANRVLQMFFDGEGASTVGKNQLRLRGAPTVLDRGW
jgi:hypothetical protein